MSQADSRLCNYELTNKLDNGFIKYYKKGQRISFDLDNRDYEVYLVGHELLRFPPKKFAMIL